MGLRAKWLLCAVTAVAALLSAATFAQAAQQTPKNGCTSPAIYNSSFTSPTFQTPTSGTSQVRFKAWFEVEAYAAGGFDHVIVEYTTPALAGVWTELGKLSDLAPANTGGGQQDIPYSNNGTSVTPTFSAQPYSFDLPTETSEVQVRFRFDTVDQTFQGFRGAAIDDISIDTVGSPLTEGFENNAPGWVFDQAPPGDPFWQILQNPQTVTVKSPEINPSLVTLPDNGALPAAASGTHVAWFGNVASGTFCGPDFANFAAPPDTVITDGPPDSTASNDATFSFASTGSAAFFQCSIDGAPFDFCASPQTYTGLSNGQHTFAVQAVDLTGTPDPTPATRTWTIREATLADLPNPQQGVSVNVDQVSGTVLVGVRTAATARAGARGSQKGINFVPLSEAEQIPVGSFLDTRKGTVALQSARDRSGRRQSGKFLQGLFQVRQSRKRRARGLTDLVLKGSSFARCGRRGKGATASLSRRQIRRLRANARGRFRTSGSNSSATVRGTIWDITDRCDGTLTHVKRGKVVVRDFRRRKNITLTSGKTYLAKARF
jgi:hypothetical protein